MNLLRNGGEGQGENHGRRREDHPDWKMAAPRWVLVVGVVVGGAIATANFREFVKKTAGTAAQVGALQGRQERTERLTANMAIQIAQVRVDSLRWQVYQGAKTGVDASFLEDLRARLRDAERTLFALRRETELEEP